MGKFWTLFVNRQCVEYEIETISKGTDSFTLDIFDELAKKLFLFFVAEREFSFEANVSSIGFGNSDFGFVISTPFANFIQGNKNGIFP